MIITKDSEPRNHQEKTLEKKKKILQDIILKANDENYVFNNIDFLDYLTMLYGKEAKINTKEFTVNNPNKKSVSYHLPFYTFYHIFFNFLIILFLSYIILSFIDSLFFLFLLHALHKLFKLCITYYIMLQ